MNTATLVDSEDNAIKRVPGEKVTDGGAGSISYLMQNEVIL